MTQQRRTALKELQQLDMRIREAKQLIQDFDPRFAEVEEPALVLQTELERTRPRLQEMQVEERRLSGSAEEKRVRQTRLDERLGSVRNLREEAAVSAELEMIKRAVQSDEQEALTLIDQIQKMEDRLAELEEAFAEADGLVKPATEALLAERDQARADFDSLAAERESFASAMNPAELKLYDAIRAGGRAIAVANLTTDGACGHCYGVIPLQLQNDIRHGNALIRCEACGVIISAPDPEELEEAEAASEAGDAAGGDEADESAADDATADDETEAGADEVLAAEASEEE